MRFRCAGKFFFERQVIFGVAQFDIERVLAHHPAHFDAERAGVELIDRHVGGLCINGVLRGGVAFGLVRTGEKIDKQKITGT